MNDNNDGNFHKGLFYGMIFGIGLVWFLGTKEGKKVKEELLARGQNFIETATETIEANFEESQKINQ
jgi:hypothetical protein